jgi:hypothetical protein
MKNNDADPSRVDKAWIYSLSAVHITVYMSTTDSGPDEVAATKQVEKLCSANLFCWVIRQYCVMHQLHLSVLKLLAKMGSHWSDLSKCVNCWRSPHASGRLYQAWKEIAGDAQAEAVFRRLPPRPLKGRWGSVATCERFFLEAQWAAVVRGFEKVHCITML